MTRRSREPQLTVIWWRDIPAQIVARHGADTVKAALPDRFQQAIDRAAMRAGVAGSDAYLAYWRRVSRPCGPELQREVDAEVATLDDRYPTDTLATLARGTATAPTVPTVPDKDIPA